MRTLQLFRIVMEDNEGRAIEDESCFAAADSVEDAILLWKRWRKEGAGSYEKVSDPDCVHKVDPACLIDGKE